VPGPEDVEHGVLQQQDGLRIPDLAGLHHPERALEGQIEHFDFLFIDAAAAVDALCCRVLGNEEVQDLGHRARRHIRFEYLAYLSNFVASLLAQLAPDTFLRPVGIQQAGAGFDQQPRSIAVDERRQAELAGQQDGLAREVVQQHRGAIAAVIGFATLRLPGPVRPPDPVGHLAQGVPVVREHFGLQDFDDGSHVR
jgi:hypothetical protein